MMRSEGVRRLPVVSRDKRLGGSVSIGDLSRKTKPNTTGKAMAAIAETGRWLGIGLAGLVNILNPLRGVPGGLFSQIHPLVADAVEANLDRFALAAPRQLVSVVPSTLGVDAPLLGAAELAFEPLLADPAAWLGPRESLVQLKSA